MMAKVWTSVCNSTHKLFYNFLKFYGETNNKYVYFILHMLSFKINYYLFCRRKHKLHVMFYIYKLKLKLVIIFFLS